MRRLFTRAYLNRYRRHLVETGASEAEVRRKLASLGIFIRWASAKGFLTQNEVWQIKEDLAKIASKSENLERYEGSKDKKPSPIFETIPYAGTLPSVGDFDKVRYTGEKHQNGLKGEFYFTFNLQTYKIRSFLFGLLKNVPLLGERIGTRTAMTQPEEAPSQKDHQPVITPPPSSLELGPQHYLGFVMVLIFVVSLGIGIYTQFFQKTATPFAYPTSLTRGSRTLSFQGRLTDSLKNPITTATNMVFRLYSDSSSTAPQYLLYNTGTCAITPDQDGIFNALIGQDCGAEIGSSVFTENQNVYLDVQVGSENLTPRQQIANVGYAMNAETLQGFPAGTGATAPFIPYFDADGLMTVNTPGASISLGSGTGPHQITTGGTTALALMAGGNVGIGTTAPSQKVDIAGTGSNLTFSGTTTVHQITTGGSSDLSLNPGGNVGVGMTNPSYKLDVLGTFHVSSSSVFDSTVSLADGSRSTPALNFTSDPNTGIYRIGTDKISIVTGGNDTITIDANGNAGIGFTNPASRLTVAGGAAIGTTDPSSLFLNRVAPSGGLIVEGNVGIGNTGTSYKLDVSGNTNIGSTLTVNGFRFGTSVTPGYVLTADASGYGTWQASQGQVTGTGGANYLARWINSNQLSTGVSYDNGSFLGVGYTAATGGVLLVNGNVGIGTTNPTTALDVVGTTNLQGTSVNQLYNSSVSTLVGNVGIGTTGGAGYKLYVAGAIYGTTLVQNGNSVCDSSGNCPANLSGGATNYLARWISATQLSTGISYDNGTFLGVGTTIGSSTLTVGGNASIGVAYTGVAAPTNGLLVQGNVGIGTTNPDAPIAISSGAATSNSGIKLTGGVSSGQLSLSSGIVTLSYWNANYFELIGGGSVVMQGVNDGVNLQFARGARFSPLSSSGYDAVKIRGVGSQTGDYIEFTDSSDNYSASFTPTSNSNQRLRFYLYNTLESTPTNYERLAQYADNTNNVFRIETENGGTGVLRDLALQGAGGNLGVGTTSPGARVEIAGNITALQTGVQYGVKINPTLSATLTTGPSAFYSLYNVPTINIGGTAPNLTNFFGQYIGANVGIGVTSTLTNYYGLYISSPNTSPSGTITNRYAFVTEPNAGNVGLGTTAPYAGVKLDVAGQVRVGTTGAVTANNLCIDSNGILSACNASSSLTGTGQTNYLARWLSATELSTGVSYDNGTFLGVGTTASGSKLVVSGGLGIGTTVQNSTFLSAAAPSGGAIIEGNVGIGTTLPNAKLQVVGVTNLQGTTASQFYSSGAITGATTLNIVGLSTLAGTTASQFYSTGAIAGGSTLTITGLSNLAGTTVSQFYSTGAITGGTTLNVVGLSTLAGTTVSQFHSTGAISGATTLTITGLSNLAGTTVSQLHVTGATTLNTLNVSALSTLAGATASQLQVTGGTTLNTLNATGLSTLAGTTASQFHSTGALSGASTLTITGLSNLAGTTVSQFYSTGAISGGSSLNIVGNSNLAGTTVSQLYNSGVSTLSGNVGIGTTGGAGYKLYVAGAIYGTTLVQNGNTVCDSSGNCPSSLTGTGATNYLARWISATQLSTGVSYDNGSGLGVGTTAPSSARFYVAGSGTGTDHAVRVTNSAGTDLFVIRDNGNIGIGVTNPAYRLTVKETKSDTSSGSVAMNYNELTADPGGANSSTTFIAAWNRVFTGVGSTGTYNIISGLTNEVIHQSPSTITTARAFSGTVKLDSSDANTIISNGNAIETSHQLVTIGTIDKGRGLLINNPSLGTGGSVNQFAGINIANLTTATDNTYILLGQSSSFPTGSWGIYNASTASNYFAGNIGIGNSSPGSNKLLVAGSTVIGIGYTGVTAPTNGLAVQGNVGIGSTGRAGFVLDVGGNVNIGTGATVANSVMSPLFSNTSGSVQFGSSGVGTTVNGASVYVSPATTLGSSLTVIGNSNLAGTTASQLHVTGATTLNTLTASGLSNLAGTTVSQFYSTGAITGGTSLNIVGNSNLAGTTVNQLYNSNVSTLVGNVGIGTTAGADYKLYVAGAIYGTTFVQNGNSVCDSSGNCPASLSGGATNYLARWISATQLSTGVSYDNGSFVGIGYTVSPGTSSLIVNGNVGIGTSNPNAKLQVVGVTNLEGATASQLHVTGTSTLNTLNVSGLSTLAGTTASQFYSTGAIAGGSTLTITGLSNLAGTTVSQFYSTGAITGATSLNIVGNSNLAGTTVNQLYNSNVSTLVGNVGIGTTAGADYKLYVAGAIYGTTFVQNGNTVCDSSNNCPVALSGGATNYLARWISSSQLSTGVSYDNGTFLGVGYTAGTGGVLLVNGNVGIGSTTPAAQLDIFKYTAVYNTGPTLKLTRDYTNNDYGSAIFDGWNGSQDALYIGVASNGDPTSASNIDMTILSDGKVGIGTTAPGRLLELSAASGSVLRVTDTTNTVQAELQAGDATAAIGTFSNHRFDFFTNNAVKMSIDTAGNVGIATTNPSGQLEVSGNISIQLTGVSYGTKLTTALTGTLDSSPQTAHYGLYNVPYVATSGSTPHLSNLYVGYNGVSLGTGTTISNYYGQYIAAPTGSTAVQVASKFALVTETGAGNVGIGTTRPIGALLDVEKEDDSIEVGCSGSTCWTDANGIIGFPGSGANHGEIAYYPSIGSGGSFGLVESSSGDPGGDYGPLSFGLSFVDLWANNGIFEGNIGVGFSSPTSKLSIAGGAVVGVGFTATSAPTNGLLVQGSVGIGTTAGTNMALTVLGSTNFLTGITAPNVIYSIGANSPLASSGGQTPTLSCPTCVFGVGATNYIGRWVGSQQMSTGALYDNGTLVGIGTTGTPRGQLDAAGTGDIYLVRNSVAGTTQSLYLPGHIFISPYNGTDISYLQARRSDSSGSTELQLRTYNAGVLTEAVRIDSEGNVGVGNVTPGARLDVTNAVAGNALTGRFWNTSTNAAASTSLRLAQSSTSTGQTYPALEFADTSYWVGSIAADRTFGLRLRTGTNISSGERGLSDRLTIDPGGNVGIGISDPVAKLQILNNVATEWLDNFSEYQLVLYNSGAATSSYGLGIKNNTIVFNSGTGAYSFDDGGSATSLYISTTGHVGIGTTVPTNSKASGNYRSLDLQGAWGSDLRLGTLGSTQWDIWNHYSLLQFDMDGDTRMAIDSSGDVGIGTTVPASRLHVVTTGNTDVEIQSGTTATNASLTLDSNTDWSIYSTGSGSSFGGDKFIVNDGGSIPPFVISGENIGINTTSPNSNLHVAQDNNISTYHDYGQIEITGRANENEGLALGFDTTDNYGYISSREEGVSVRSLILQPLQGNIGIGATNPITALHLLDDSTAAPVSELGNFAISTGSTANRLLFGLDSATTVYSWIQSITSGTAYRTLALNPSGGNVGIGTTTPSSTLHVSGTITGTDITCSNCLNQGDIANSAIGQGELKTTTETDSVNDSGCAGATTETNNVTVANGEYGFNPSLRRSAACTTGGGSVSISGLGNAITSSTATRYVTLGTAGSGTAGGTLTAETITRYVQATPPYYIDGYYVPHFIWVMWDKDTGHIRAVSEAEDPVWENNTDDPDQVPHPWVDYYRKPLPANLEIALIDPSNISELKKKAKEEGLTTAGYINMYLTVNPVEVTPPTSPQTGQPIRLPRQVAWRTLKPETPERIAVIEASRAKAAELELENPTPSLDQMDPADLAELYPSAPNLMPGDIVEPFYAHAGEENVPEEKKDDMLLRKSSTPYSPTVIGIISNNPAHILNVGGSDGQLPLALAGRVPVKVSDLNGPIKIGDPVSASTIPGIGMKSKKAGTIVGKALEEFNPSENQGRVIPCPDGTASGTTCGMIIVFVNTSWYDPDAYLTSTGDFDLRADNSSFVYSGEVEADTQGVSGQSFTLLNAAGETIDRVGAFAEVIVAKVKTGYLSAENAVIGQVLVAKNITSEQITSLTGRFDRLLVDERITSPVVETDTLTVQDTAKIPLLETSEIKPQVNDLTVNLSQTAPTGSGELAKLIIKGLENKTVASIDAAGNATFSGTLAAREASVSGTLIAGSLNTTEASVSGRLVAGRVEAENISSLESNLASQSADLTSLSSNVNDVQKLLADLKNQPLPDPTYYQALPSDLPSLASTSATLADLTTDSLTVSGQSNLFNLTVSGSAMVGTVLIEDNSILALSSELKLSSLERINFFDGRVVIAKDGTITTTGTLIAQGGVETNRITAVGGEGDVSVVLTDSSGRPQKDKLKIQNTLGTEVASIDASGSAYFKNGIAFEKYLEATSSAAIIAASDTFAKHGVFAPSIETKAETAGIGILPQGSPEVIVYNDSVKKDSLIYLTPTTGLAAGQLTVSEKVDCENAVTSCQPYFKVVLGTPPVTDVRFNWLIVQ